MKGENQVLGQGLGKTAATWGLAAKPGRGSWPNRAGQEGLGNRFAWSLGSMYRECYLWLEEPWGVPQSLPSILDPQATWGRLLRLAPRELPGRLTWCGGPYVMEWALGSSPSSLNALGFHGSVEGQGQSKQGSGPASAPAGIKRDRRWPSALRAAGDGDPPMQQQSQPFRPGGCPPA